MKILLTGGSGLLGNELKKLDTEILAPTHAELDVRDPKQVADYIESERPTMVIHGAAVTRNLDIEKDPEDAIEINVKGTANIALVCLQQKIRLVYPSIDYVYSGEHGNYREDDEVLPCNDYAWSKLGGEASVRLVPNHLIIRTSFGPSEFPYPGAFADKWASKDYVDRIAPMILEAAKSPITGILNVGTARKTLFEFAKERNPDVNPISLEDTPHHTPTDTSLNIDKWEHYRHDPHPVAVSVESCRVCGNKDLPVYLDLGLMPLANNLGHNSKAARDMERFPLQVCFCTQCSLSQLSVVVDPGKLFNYYTYRSSINPGFVIHCRQMATAVNALIPLGKDDLCVDIAGNDGTLLDEFREELGVKVLNIEPAGNIAAIAAARGIDTINEFWSQDVAKKVETRSGRAKVITATNVFAHVDDVRSFLAAAKSCLDEEGAMILEFPYLVDLIKKREFDTVYFEHLSYLPVRPVIELARSLDMTVFNIEKQAIHGGTVRVFISPNSNRDVLDSVSEFEQFEAENNYDKFEGYLDWSEGVNDLITNLGKNLARLKSEGAKISAFGASAKGNTLLNACRLNAATIDYIVDDTPEKIGKFSPGTGIPIVNRSELYKHKPDYLVVLAWNFIDDILENTSEYRQAGGKYIVPIPEFRVIGD